MATSLASLERAWQIANCAVGWGGSSRLFGQVVRAGVALVQVNRSEPNTDRVTEVLCRGDLSL